MERRMIGPGFVEEALWALRRKGLDTGPALKAAGIEASALADPTFRMSAEAYGALWLTVSDALQDEYFGLGGRAMRPGSFTMLTYAIVGSGTLGVALRRALRFLTVMLEEPRGRMTVSDGLVVITLQESGPPRSAFAYRTFWIILHGLICWLVGRRLPIRRVDFRGAEPAGGTDYRLFFGAPVRFGQPASLMAFDARYLTLPIDRSERAVKEFLRRAPANLLVRYRHDAGIAGEVRARLRALAPADWPTLEALAAQMRMPVPTLRRRLRQEGDGYAEIKDALRHQAAIRALKETGRPVAEIAADLGFAEPSAFHRAFRKWTGTTPAAFRRATAPSA